MAATRPNHSLVGCYRPSRINVNAYHLAGAIQHLANACAECGRD